MSKDTRVFIKHILESITYIEQYTSGITREIFFDSPPTSGRSDQKVRDNW